MGILNNVAVQWLIRRVPDWGGQITFLVSLYLALPQEHKDTINAVLQGQGGGLTISAVIGFVAFVYAQIISYRATVRQQVVQKVGGQTVTTPMSEVSDSVEANVKVATPAPRRRTLLDVLAGK